MESMNTVELGREEFGALVELYHRRVLKTAMRTLGKPGLVADAVQNTYLKAWINRHSLRSREAFGRWLEVICRHECWRAVRNDRNGLPLDALPFEPHAAHGEQEDNPALYAALSQLGEGDVELLSLVYFAGLSLREAGLLLGVGAKKVKSRLYESRRRLKKLLGPADRPESAGIGEDFKNRRKVVMDSIKRMDLGSHCIPRMSLSAQKELLASAERNGQFSEMVLAELGRIDQGRELVAATDGRLSLTELMEILSCCDQPTVERLLAGTAYRQAFLGAAPAGYVVLENNAILHTMDMDATVRWFERTLGWHGGVDARDEQGNGTYGCLLPDNPRAVTRSTRVFEGIHMFRGEPVPATLAFIRVSGLNALRQLVAGSGWGKLDDIREEPWGARVCHVETPEGYVLKFFEIV